MSGPRSYLDNNLLGGRDDPQSCGNDFRLHRIPNEERLMRAEPGRKQGSANLSDLAPAISGIRKNSPEVIQITTCEFVPISRLLSSNWSVIASAFIGTNPADAPITSELPVTREELRIPSLPGSHFNEKPTFRPSDRCDACPRTA